MNGNDPKHIKLCSATSSHDTVFHTVEGWRMRDDEIQKTARCDAENLAI